MFTTTWNYSSVPRSPMILRFVNLATIISYILTNLYKHEFNLPIDRQVATIAETALEQSELIKVRSHLASFLNNQVINPDGSFHSTVD